MANFWFRFIRIKNHNIHYIRKEKFDMLQNFFRKNSTKNTLDLTNADNALNYLLIGSPLRDRLETESCVENSHIYCPKWQMTLTLPPDRTTDRPKCSRPFPHFRIPMEKKAV